SLKDGEKAKLEIIRNGKRQTLDVGVGAMPDDDADIGAGAQGSAERSSNRLGVSVADLTAEQKKSLELKGGVVIKEVQDGPAAMIGLR
ncbi:serine peptidase, partial [Pseudomonas sp. SIMBA_059]